MDIVSTDIVLEGDNRLLTDRDKELIADGREPVGGAALMAPGQNHPETLWDARHKIAQMHLLKKQAKELADLQGFMQAHRDQAHRMYAAKFGVILGILSEMEETDEAGNTYLNTSKVDSKRLDMLFKYVNQVEQRAFGGTAQVTRHEGEVDVRHSLAEARQKLIEASD